MQTEIIQTNETTDHEAFQAIAQIVVSSVESISTKKAYIRGLTDFLRWYDRRGRPRLIKAIVQEYKAELTAAGMGAASINQRLSAIKKFVRECADNDLVDESVSRGIDRVKSIRQLGRRLGNWLTRDEAEDLLNAPDASSLKGLRDQAILAILIGTGLRREECASLTFDHLQQRDGRWVILDLVGKGNRKRSVPIPSWSKAAIDRWTIAAGLTDGRLFWSINRGGHLVSEGMTGKSVYRVVKEYASTLGAHDCRRTFAKLSYKGGAGIEQIQKSLGHSSIQTTERYIGADQDLTDAPCDHLGIRL